MTMLRLGREFLQGRRSPEIEAPPAHTLDLPEKVLQFGAGVFLRAFLEDFIQQANTRGDFNGRVVVVQRAPDARSADSRRQDALYTLWLRGVSAGALTETRRVIGSISRILAASEQWSEVLDLARSPHLEVIVSNSTEVGYAPEPGDSPGDFNDASPPASFPAKLARVLWERFEHFRGDTARAPLVIPCELLENNGPRLRDVVLDLAGRWGLPPGFSQWVEEHVTFASTLVDRIVTGPPARPAMEQEWSRLGYRDEMLIAAEPYYLFAVEDPNGVARANFPIHLASPNVLFTADIQPYWRRKLRLLNGPHTLLAPQGLMAGCRTVKEALERPELSKYLEDVMLGEIAPVLGDNDVAAAEAFAREVLDRFANPFVEHLLANISVNCATKLGVRVFPVVRTFHEKHGRLPQGLLHGIAAVIYFTRGRLGEVRDPAASFFAAEWAGVTSDSSLEAGSAGELEAFVARLLSNTAAWSGQALDPAIFAPPIARALAELVTRHG